LLDRLDLHVAVSPVPFEDLDNDRPAEPSSVIRRRVEAARTAQLKRYMGTSIHSNARLTPAMTREYCKLDEDSTKLLSDAFLKLGLSARAHDRILKVARTIADLDGCNDIQISHLAEAISYRSIDPKSVRY
jgi:magnesium chelatase family protein